MTQVDGSPELLKDLKQQNTVEILREVYGSKHLGIARRGARINDLKKLGHHIVGYDDPRNGRALPSSWILRFAASQRVRLSERRTKTRLRRTEKID